MKLSNRKCRRAGQGGHAMNRLEPNTGEFVSRPALDQDPGWLGRVVESLPIPALVIETASFAIVRTNEAARCVPLVSPEQDEPTLRIGPEGLSRELIQAATGPEGT